MRHAKRWALALAVLTVLASGEAVFAEGGRTADTGGTGEKVNLNSNTTVSVPNNSALGALQRMKAGDSGGSAPVEVTADAEVAVRSAKSFGMNIIGNIKKGDKFKVKGRDMAWFDIEFTQSPAYVYITLVTSNEGQQMQTDPTVAGAQQRIKQAAYNVLDEVPFPYAPATQNGNLGCAQVATTALKQAGVLDKIELGVLATMDDLKAKGWRLVSPPPWKDGDVVTWNTDQPDGHIGIVIFENGQAYAMNNSSSKREPQKHLLATYYAPVSHVLRMPGA